MTKETVNLKQAYKMEPEEIVNYFQSKGLKTSYNWREVYEEAHAKAFTVAKMTDIDLLKDTHDMLTKSIKEGWSEGHWTREAKDLFAKKGWTGFKEVENPETGGKETVELGTPRRIKNIFRNNINSAYAAGRYKQQLEDVDIAPYFQYMCILDESTRPEHRAMHGKVFRYDDPFWAAFYPPNGWGCRCFVRSLTPNEIKKRGLTVEQSGDDLKEIDIGDKRPVGSYKFKLGGKEYNLTADAGWSTNMGAHAWNLDVLAYNKIENLSQNLKDKFISDMASNPHNKKAFENFVNSVIKNGMKTQNYETTITWIMPELLNTLSKNGVKLKTPVVVMQDDRVGHIIGDRKKLTAKQLCNAYDIINNPDAFYYDYTQKGVTSIAFIKNIPDSENCIKVCIKLDKTADKDYKRGNEKNYKLNTKHSPVNYLSTAGIIEKGNLEDAKLYKKIE